MSIVHVFRRLFDGVWLLLLSLPPPPPPPPLLLLSSSSWSFTVADMAIVNVLVVGIMASSLCMCDCLFFFLLFIRMPHMCVIVLILNAEPGDIKYL